MGSFSCQTSLQYVVNISYLTLKLISLQMNTCGKNKNQQKVIIRYGIWLLDIFHPQHTFGNFLLVNGHLWIISPLGGIGTQTQTRSSEKKNPCGQLLHLILLKTYTQLNLHQIIFLCKITTLK